MCTDMLSFIYNPKKLKIGGSQTPILAHFAFQLAHCGAVWLTLAKSPPPPPPRHTHYCSWPNFPSAHLSGQLNITMITQTTSRFTTTMAITPPFQSEGNYAFVNTTDLMGRRQMKIFRCLKPAYGGKGSTFWKRHCLRKIALEKKIKRPYPKLINLVSIYLEKNISNTLKINGIQSRMSLKLRIN